MIKPLLHYGLHFGAPFLLALFFRQEHRHKTLCIMLCTMLVDADHLLATPVFSPDRMSIGFHPLHSYPAIAIYATVFALTFIMPKCRIHLPRWLAPQQHTHTPKRLPPQQHTHQLWWLRPLCLGLLCHMLIDYLDFTLWH